MQEIIVYILVGLAALFLVFKLLWPKKKKDCGTDCNCH